MLEFFLIGPPEYINEDYSKRMVMENIRPVPAFAISVHERLDFAILVDQDGTETHECQPL